MTDQDVRTLLRDAMLRGDRREVLALTRVHDRERLIPWKNGIFSALTEEYLAGGASFCTLTAAAEAASALCGAGASPAACCGALKGDPDTTSLGYLQMLLRAWGVPCLCLGSDLPAESFLAAVRERSVRFVICSAFREEDLKELRRLHEEAVRTGLRDRFRLLISGMTPDQTAAYEQYLDHHDHRAAAAAQWVAEQWNE